METSNVTFIKKKKLIIIMVASIILIGIGFYVGYFQNNKRIIAKALDNISTTVKDRYLMNHDDMGIKDDFTLKSDVTMDIKSDLLKQTATYSPDYLAYYNLITNLSKTDNKLVFKQDKTNQKLFVDLESTYNKEELISLKYLIENNTEYYYIKGFLDTYINNGTSNYFEALQSNTTSSENMEYVYNFAVDSFKNNLKKEYFTKNGEKVEIDGKEKTLQKIALEINNDRLVEIATAVLKDLKDDSKANKILIGIDKDFKDAKVTKNKKILEKNQKIVFSVYTDNLTYQIRKYKLDFIDGSDMSTITYEENENGLLNIYENNKLEGNLVITYNKDNTDIKINDGNNKNIGQVEIENKDNSYSINMNIKSEDVNVNLSLQQDITNIKKNKSYTSKVTVYGDASADGISIGSVKVIANNKVTKGAKIDESIDNAVFANDVDSNKQAQLQQNLMGALTKLMS